MVRGSFASMQAQTTTEVTFYYENGETDTLKIPLPAQQFQEQLPQVLKQPWLTFHLMDETVTIATAKIMKIEIKPPIAGYQGEGVFANCEMVTALQRGARGRFPVQE